MTSVPRLRRALLLAAFLAQALAACQVLRAPDRLVADLQATGLAASIGTDEDADLQGGQHTTVCVGAASISVYQFADGASARTAAGLFNDDDAEVRGDAFESWPGRPRFWLRDNAIVIYLGEDAALDKALRTILGVPFAEADAIGPRGPDESPPCF